MVETAYSMEEPVYSLEQLLTTRTKPVFRLKNEDDVIISIRNLFITDDDADDLCTICYNNLPNITLLPCKHDNICEGCFIQLNHFRDCPYCRTEIKFTIPHMIGKTYYEFIGDWGMIIT